jgi:hypothetical protein
MVCAVSPGIRRRPSDTPIAAKSLKIPYFAMISAGRSLASSLDVPSPSKKDDAHARTGSSANEPIASALIGPRNRPPGIETGATRSRKRRTRHGRRRVSLSILSIAAHRASRISSATIEILK